MKVESDNSNAPRGSAGSRRVLAACTHLLQVTPCAGRYGEGRGDRNLARGGEGGELGAGQAAVQLQRAVQVLTYDAAACPARHAMPSLFATFTFALSIFFASDNLAGARLVLRWVCLSALDASCPARPGGCLSGGTERLINNKKRLRFASRLRDHCQTRPRTTVEGSGRHRHASGSLKLVVRSTPEKSFDALLLLFICIPIGSLVTFLSLLLFCNWKHDTDRPGGLRVMVESCADDGQRRHLGGGQAYDAAAASAVQLDALRHERSLAA